MYNNNRVQLLSQVSNLVSTSKALDERHIFLISISLSDRIFKIFLTKRKKV